MRKGCSSTFFFFSLPSTSASSGSSRRGKKKKALDADECIINILKNKGRANKKSKRMDEMQTDPLKTFFLGLYQQTKTFNRVRQIEVKTAILQIMLDAEMAEAKNELENVSAQDEHRTTQIETVYDVSYQ